MHHFLYLFYVLVIFYKHIHLLRIGMVVLQYWYYSHFYVVYFSSITIHCRYSSPLANFNYSFQGLHNSPWHITYMYTSQYSMDKHSLCFQFFVFVFVWCFLVWFGLVFLFCFVFVWLLWTVLVSLYISAFIFYSSVIWSKYNASCI